MILRRDWAVLALILGVMTFAYRGVVHNGFVLDDFHTVVNNRSLESFGGSSQWFLSGEGVSGEVESRGYRPVLMAGYALDRAVWGDGARGYHLGNLAVHGAVVVLAWLLAKRLWGDSVAALIAALVVALHPLNAEAVNYIAARSSSLMTLWVLAAVWCYDEAMVGASSLAPWRRRAVLGGAVVAALGALGTKEAAAVLPVLIMIWDRARAVSREYSWRGTLARSVVFWAAVAGLLVVRAALLGGVTAVPVVNDPLHAIGLVAKLATFSLGHWFWPTGLAIDYAWPKVLSAGESAWWTLVFVAALGLTYAAVRTNRRIGWCLVWFWVGLLPVLTLPLVTHLVLYQEHRSYLGGVALAWAVGGAAASAWRSMGRVRVAQAAGIAAAVTLAVAAVWVDIARTAVWRDGEQVWNDSLAKYPNSALGHNARAIWLAETGDLEAARSALERSLAVDPSRVRTHSLLGALYGRMGRYDRALAEFTIALRLAPSDSHARMNLGKAYEAVGRSDQALDVYGQLVRDYPRHAPALGRSAVILERAGRLAEAAERYRAVVALDPSDDTAREALGAVCLKLERWEEAETVFATLASGHPNSGASWFNLGTARERLGRENEALDAFGRAAALAPEDPDPEFRIGMILARRGTWDAAAAAYERAIARDPNHGLSHLNLAIGSERQGDRARAVWHYRAVRRIVGSRAEGDEFRRLAESGLARLGGT
ncbi:MAG: tetratricopeptide repeat protein [Nitrospirota bacterium]